MFTLRVKDKFSAAHQLVGYPGDCANLHGHTWEVEVVIAGTLLDELEMLIDFRDVKNAMQEVISPLDHAGSLNDILKIALPTAEYLSWHIFHGLLEILEDLGLPEGVFLREVTVWESDNASVTYSQDINDRYYA